MAILTQKLDDIDDDLYHEILTLVQSIQAVPIDNVPFDQSAAEIATDDTLYQLMVFIITYKQNKFYSVLRERINELTSLQKSLIFSEILINVNTDLYGFIKENIDALETDDDIIRVIKNILGYNADKLYDLLPDLINHLQSEENRDEILITTALNKPSPFDAANQISSHTKEKDNIAKYQFATIILTEKLDDIDDDLYHEILTLVQSIQAVPIDNVPFDQSAAEIATDDTLYQLMVFIITYKQNKFYSVLRERINELTSLQKSLIFSEILINVNTDLYGFIKENIDALETDSDTTRVIEIIIGNKIHEQYDLLPDLINHLQSETFRGFYNKRKLIFLFILRSSTQMLS